MSEKRVSVYDITLDSQRAEYEELVNSKNERVVASHDMPTATGAILRIVDHLHKEPKTGEFIYAPPIC